MMTTFQYQTMFMDRFWPFFWLIIPLVFLDIALKGWGMWRAARMHKTAWFIALLFINSVGILPAIFLVITNDEYIKNRT